jgi:hypothetical protein
VPSSLDLVKIIFFQVQVYKWLKCAINWQVTRQMQIQDTPHKEVVPKFRSSLRDYLVLVKCDVAWCHSSNSTRQITDPPRWHRWRRRAHTLIDLSCHSHACVAADANSSLLARSVQLHHRSMQAFCCEAILLTEYHIGPHGSLVL